MNIFMTYIYCNILTITTDLNQFLVPWFPEAGTLSSCSVAELAKRYKAWLYLNPKGLSVLAKRPLSVAEGSWSWFLDGNGRI